MRVVLGLFVAGLVNTAACGAGEVATGDDVPDATPAIDAPPPVPRCEPASGGPYWLEEGQALQATITCAGEATVAEAGLGIDDLPSGATFDATTGVLTWTPTLGQADVYRLRVTVATTGETEPLLIGVADAFDAEGNTPIADPLTYTHEYGLPVIHLAWQSEDPNFCRDGVDRDYAPATIIALGHAYTAAELRCRGAASLTFPKKSFTLKFGPGDRFNAPGEDGAFAARKRVVLTQTFDDVSYLRTRLAFELWNRLDPSHVQIAHGSAVVFVDGAYWGLYQITDHVDDDLLAMHGTSANVNVYKSYNHMGNLRAELNDDTPKSDLTVGYEKKEGADAADFSDLTALLAWLTAASDAEITAELDTRLATSEFVDWYVFATAIMAADSYGKNSYLFRDPDEAAARWHYAPWDMNESFGQDWQTFRMAYDDEGAFDGWPMRTNGVWRRMAAIPALRARIEARFVAALAGPMQLTDVLAEIDAIAARLEPSALRDQRKWAAQHRSFEWWSGRDDINDFAGEIAYVKQWCRDRWAYLGTLY